MKEQRYYAQAIADDLGLANTSFVDSISYLLPDQLLRISQFLKKPDHLNQVQDFKLNETELVLSNKRFPFCDYSNDLITGLIISTLEYPEKVGDLTSWMRAILGLPSLKPSAFTIVEAHLNSTHLDHQSLEALVSLGFEPDNFYKLSPECYDTNLTLGFCVPGSSQDRLQTLKRVLEKRSEDASEILQGLNGVSAFIESEVYGSKNLIKFDQRGLFHGIQMVDFPFDSATFQVKHMPQTVEETTEELGLDARKRIDVHAKIKAFELRDDGHVHQTPEFVSLRNYFLDAGFYEIISESGNAIYTAQFLKVRDGLNVFRRLKAFCEMNGGFVDLCAEVCNAFWRKESRDVHGTRLAEVSPVLIPN